VKQNRQHSTSYQAGFSLVEILVGLVIGLLATLVIMQVFSVFEGQKRTTTGSADAQTNGGIALYTMTRDLQMAGFGLLPVSDSAIKCAVPAIFPAAAASVSSLSPVTITDGGAAAGASDSITIRYGSSPAAGTPVPITLMTGGVDSIVDNNLGCETGIAIILTGSTTCNVTTVTALTGTTGVTLGDGGSATAGNSLACMGQWNEITYRSNAGRLERNATPAIADIVNIQAQYGISNAASSNQVVQWVNATAGGTWDSATITTANRNLIKAVRVAVVARNGLLEKDNVTVACTTNKGTVNNGPCAWDDTNFDAAPAIDLSNDPDWQRYRYRVFETIIPLRNVIWSKDTLI